MCCVEQGALLQAELQALPPHCRSTALRGKIDRDGDAGDETSDGQHDPPGTLDRQVGGGNERFGHGAGAEHDCRNGEQVHRFQSHS